MEKKSLPFEDIVYAMVPGILIGGLLGGVFTGLKTGLQRQPDYAGTFARHGIMVEAFDDNDVVAQNFAMLLPKRDMDARAFDDAVLYADRLMKLSASLTTEEAKAHHYVWATDWCNGTIENMEIFRKSCKAKAHDSVQRDFYLNVLKPKLKTISQRMSFYKQSIQTRVNDAMKLGNPKTFQPSQVQSVQHEHAQHAQHAQEQQISDFVPLPRHRENMTLHAPLLSSYKVPTQMNLRVRPPPTL